MNNKDFSLTVSVCAAVVFILSVVSFFINKICGIICLAAGVFVLTAFIILTKRRYKKISELNDYLSAVCSGNLSMDISDNAEGELSILKNNLYKVIVLLRSSNDALKNDKVYLADSLADISHQLKTPLTSMMVITDLLKDEKDVSKRNEFVDIIENQCEKMKWLITTLLKFSKLDAGTADFKMDSYSAASLIDESIKPFFLTMELREITFDSQIEECYIRADKNWTVEAIANIIKNCIEHTENGGFIKVFCNSTALYNQIIIKDNGCGITAEDLPHIFERFYHGKNSSSDSVGIGLALSKEILKKENASITVNSVEGEGSEFVIRFYKSII